MADDDDRQPPQAYDTVAPAGVGATTTNQVSPGTIQEILDTGDQSIIDQAFEQIEDAGDYDALTRYMESLPDLGMPVQVSSPAGVGRPGSQSYRSIQTSPESSGARTPASPPSVPLAAGARTAAGAGGDGNGSGRGGRGGRRGPRTRGGGRGGAGGGGRGGAGGGGGGGGGAGAGGGGGGGGGVGGGGRRGGRRGRRTPTSPASTSRGSWSPGRQPRTLRQADLQRRLRMMLQDQEQLAQGRDIANVTMTNSIVTSYKQGGAPSVQTSSSRISP